MVPLSMSALRTALLCLIGTAAGTSSVVAGPIASLSAFKLDFAAQAVGATSDPQTITVTNTGDAALTLSSVTVNSLDFTLTAGTGAGILPAGGSREIEVRYAPWNLGKRSALLTITSDAPNSPIGVGLFGAEYIQPGPRVSVSPSFCDLGFEVVGSTSYLNAYFTNFGTAPLTIKSVKLAGTNASDFQIIDGGSPGIVNRDTYRFIRVLFHPTAPGPRNAYLVVDDDAPGSPHTFVMFSSSAPSPNPIRFSPTTVDFGVVPEGTTSAQTITLTNTGKIPVNILGIALGPPNEEHYALANASPGPIGPGESRAITVLFVPMPNGAPYEVDTEILRIAHDALPGDSSPLAIPLTGTHVATNCHLSSTLAFGSQLVGTTSDPQTVTLTNTSAAPLAIVGLDLHGQGTGAYSVDASSLGRILAPGAAANVSVRFAPTAMGQATASLSVATNANPTTSPDSVGLTGTGVMPVLRLSPTALDFGREPVGLSGNRALLLQNTGNAPLTVGSISFQGSNGGDFSLGSDTASGQVLQPGDIGLLNIQFSPTAPGPRSATLVISDDAAGSPQLVSLTGVGTAPLLVLNATGLVFSIHPAADGTNTQTLTLTNNGDAPLKIDDLTLSGPSAASFHIVTDSGEKSLDPGASRTVTISFSPAAVASVRSVARIATARITAVSYSAILEVKHNDPHPGSPHQVTLTAVDTGAASSPTPAAPTSLTAAATPTNQVVLAWTDNSTNEAAFAIWRQTQGGAFVRVGVVAPNSTQFTDASALPHTTYTYKVRATNAFASDWSNLATITTPDGPPAAPAGLKVIGFSHNKVSLTWRETGSSVTRFEIYRKSGAGAYALVGTTAPGSPFYQDTTVNPTTTYTYQVRAIGDFGASAFTNEATVTTVPSPPAAPTGLKVIGFSYNKVSLAWTDNSSNETAFEIYRKSGSGAYALVGLAPPNATFYQDTTVGPTTSYTYQVRAANNYWSSAYTNSVDVTTVEAPPAAPTGLTAAAVSSTQINLTWADHSSSETAIEVYRQTGGGAYALAAVLPPGSTTFADKGLTPGTNYTYRVRAANNYWASAYTNGATAHTPTAP